MASGIYATGLSINGQEITLMANSFKTTGRPNPMVGKKCIANGGGTFSVVENLNIEEQFVKFSFKTVNDKDFKNMGIIDTARDNEGGNTARVTFNNGESKVYTKVGISNEPEWGEGTENEVDIECQAESIQ